MVNVKVVAVVKAPKVVAGSTLENGFVVLPAMARARTPNIAVKAVNTVVGALCTIAAMLKCHLSIAVKAANKAQETKKMLAERENAGINKLAMMELIVATLINKTAHIRIDPTIKPRLARSLTGWRNPAQGLLGTIVVERSATRQVGTIRHNTAMSVRINSLKNLVETPCMGVTARLNSN